MKTWTHFQAGSQGLTLSINPLNSFPHFSFADVTIAVFIKDSKSSMLLKL
jgi:hypothetical protein